MKVLVNTDKKLLETVPARTYYGSMANVLYLHQTFVFNINPLNAKVAIIWEPVNYGNFSVY